MKRNQLFNIAAILIVILLSAVACSTVSGTEPAENAEPVETDKQIEDSPVESQATTPPLTEYDVAGINQLGDINAPVVIDQFTDFNCSHCSEFFLNNGKKLIDDFVDSGDVLLVFHPFPQTPETRLAAEGAYCASEENKFWNYVEILYTEDNEFTKEFLFLLPEYQPACWMDEWLEPEVPLDEVQKEYVGKPDPKGQNPQYTAACCGDRVLKVCTLFDSGL